MRNDRASQFGGGGEQGRASGRLRVLKLGGSLLDWPDWPARLVAWRTSATHNLLRDEWRQRDLIVVGGGDWCDALRKLDERHQLGDAFCHTACLELMSLTARLAWRVLAARCSESPPGWFGQLTPANERLAIRVAPAATCSTPIAAAELLTELPAIDWAVVDAGRWLLDRDGTDAGLLPASWDVTSDSIAAWVAQQVCASELVLFKSRAPGESEASLASWVTSGLVDPFFPQIAERLVSCAIQVVNLRA